MVERRGTLGLLAHAVVILGVLIVAFPLYLAFVASTHTTQEIVQAPMPLLPGSNFWESYKHALFGGSGNGSEAPVAHMMWVSLVTALVIAIGKISISLLGAALLPVRPGSLSIHAGPPPARSKLGAKDHAADDFFEDQYTILL